MSEAALKGVVDRVVRDLEQRGFSISGKPKLPINPTGTAGFWSKIHSDENWHLEIWLDRWRHSDALELYYGFFSSRKSEVDRFLELFDGGTSFFRIETGQEESFEDDQVRLNASTATAVGHRMMLNYHRGRYWFGRYAHEAAFHQDASDFFGLILQKARSLPFWEGACKQVTLDRRERNPEARRLCLLKYGCRCQVCGIDFKERYGPEYGTDFIHVHHLTPLALGVRETIPERDLIPVCPNCHAMLHRRSPALSPDELRSMIR